jgi:hypothetical protein
MPLWSFVHLSQQDIFFKQRDQILMGEKAMSAMKGKPTLTYDLTQQRNILSVSVGHGY